jgi:flagellar biosynthesis/type III secretory pathway protein FliH
VNTLNPVASALMAKMKIARQDRPKVKAECLRLLVKLNLDAARTQLISGFVDTYLRLEGAEEQLFAQAVAQFVSPEKEQAMEIVTSWMEKGIEQGFEKGMEKGIEQGREGEARHFALRLAERKFGSLPETMKARITALSTSQLEELGLELLTLNSVDALNVWLDTQTARPNGN